MTGDMMFDRQARQSKLSKDRFERVLTSLRSGNSRTVAARAGGVDDRTLRRWMEAHDELRDAVEAAEAEAEGRHVAIVQEAAIEKKDWRAAGWWLERRRPDTWGRVDRVELLILQQQAQALAEELANEGIHVTAAELLRERDALVKHSQKALPAPTNDE
jgi:transposase